MKYVKSVDARRSATRARTYTASYALRHTLGIQCRNALFMLRCILELRKRSDATQLWYGVLWLHRATPCHSCAVALSNATKNAAHIAAHIATCTLHHACGRHVLTCVISRSSVSLRRCNTVQQRRTILIHVPIYICLYVWVCVSVCVCIYHAAPCHSGAATQCNRGAPF